jgi:hypothetical protein
MIDMVSYTERFEVEGNLIYTGYSKNRKGFNRFIYPDFNLGYVFGSYLSVGTSNISVYKGTKRGTVFWYVKKELEEFIVNLNQALNSSFGLLVKTRQKGKPTSPLQVMCYSKPLATLLENLGQRSGVKKIPNHLCFNESNDFLKALVVAIENFEGHRPDTRFVPNKRKLNMDVILLYNTLKNY